MKNKGIKKLNLALQGGGSHGAFAWGVLDRILQETSIEIDSISATSAGATNAAIIAKGLINGGNEGARKELHHFWHEVSTYGKIFSPIKFTPWEALMGVSAENSASFFIFDMVTRLFSPYQFNPFNYNPLKNLLESTIDFQQLKTTDKVKLFICATNVQTGKVKIFENKDISPEVILASSCLPFLFQAVEIDQEHYWDGGYMGNPAIFPLIYEAKSTDVLIIHINPIVRKGLPINATEIMNRINEVSFNSSLMREMRAIAFVTKLLDQGWIKEEYREKVKRMYIHSIRADELMMNFSVASKFNTDWNFLLQLFELGQKAGDTWLEENFNKIGVESSIQIEEYL